MRNVYTIFSLHDHPEEAALLFSGGLEACLWISEEGEGRRPLLPPDGTYDRSRPRSGWNLKRVEEARTS